MAITRIWDADSSEWVVVGSDVTDHVVDTVEPVAPRGRFDVGQSRRTFYACSRHLWPCW